MPLEANPEANSFKSCDKPNHYLINAILSYLSTVSNRKQPEDERRNHKQHAGRICSLGGFSASCLIATELIPEYALMRNSVDKLIISCLAVDGLGIEFGTGLWLGIG